MVKPVKAVKPKPKRDPDVYPGKLFGKLRVERTVQTKEGPRIWVSCACGSPKFKTRKQYLFRKGNPTRDCGCTLPTADPNAYTKISWHSMHLRCYYTKHVAYTQYGGRGIIVCPRWHRDNPDGWKNFLEDMGPRPQGLSIDRKDPNGIYEKNNCRWATKGEQSNNQRHKYINGIAPKGANL